MTDAQFHILATVLLGIALWRRPDRATLVLVLGFIASLSAPLARSGFGPLPWIATIDALIVVAMAGIWTQSDCMRAWSVGFVGLAKCGWTLAYASGFIAVPWLGFAVLLNALFLLQVVAVGGMMDGIGTWLDDLLRRFWPRRHQLLRNGARKVAR